MQAFEITFFSWRGRSFRRRRRRDFSLPEGGSALIYRAMRAKRSLRRPVTAPLWRAAVLGLVMLPLGAAAAEVETGVGTEVEPGVETAALGRVAEAPGAEADTALPEVLGPGDIARYGKIFALQEDGRWKAADKEIARLDDRLLMGHVLGQRYLHPTAYRSKYKELKAWLDEYADHPEARRIYRLAVKRKPRKARWPVRPVRGYLDGVGTDLGTKPDRFYRPDRRLSLEKTRRVRALKGRIRARVRSGWPTGAKEVLEGGEPRRLFSPLEYDLALADIAAGYFAYGENEKALAVATAAARRSGKRAPIAHWIAGLAAWRLDRGDTAARHFEAAAQSGNASDWNAAAAAFWAARAHLVARRPQQVSHWLKVAAERPRTFYGLLARRALGLETRFDWTVPAVAEDDVELVLRAPGARRALALLQLGQRHRAETELRKLYATVGPALHDAVLALALRGHLPALAMRIGVMMAKARGRPIDAALYPLPAWEPVGGFRIDRALLFAVMRQESRFNARAKSPAGARGLMQLMPRTAGFVAGGNRFRGKARNELFDPELNLTLGQKYVRHLLDNGMVRGNLFLMTAAYNGGPGKLAKWRRETEYRGDPLLFIESIPSRETRIFIERVLTNLWIYRQRLGQPTPSLDAVAGGGWPVYTSLDGAGVRLAQREQAQREQAQREQAQRE